MSLFGNKKNSLVASTGSVRGTISSNQSPSSTYSSEIEPGSLPRVRSLFIYVSREQVRRLHALRDVTFKVEGKRVEAHKFILAAESSYFYHMFTRNLLFWTLKT
jgi:hypothetical protein